MSSDTWVGVGWSYDGGANWRIDDENYIADRGKLSFPWVQRRYSRKLRTNFEYVREAIRRNTCAEWDVYVRATQWLPATDDSIRQRGTLDRCDRRWVKGHYPGAEFERNNEKATRYTRAVSVFDVSLTSQSGFSREVTLEYEFGGPHGKKHYICGGADGRESAATAGRVWSGGAPN